MQGFFSIWQALDACSEQVSLQLFHSTRAVKKYLHSFLTWNAGPFSNFLTTFLLEMQRLKVWWTKACNRCMLLRRSCPISPPKFSGPPKKISNRQKKSEKDKYKNLWDAMRLFFCNSCNWTRQLQLDKTVATGGSSFATAATVCDFFCFDWLTEALIKVMCDKLSSKLAVRDASRKLSVKKNSESEASGVLTNH